MVVVVAAEAEMDMAPTAEKMLAPNEEDSEEESKDDFRTPLLLLTVSRVLLFEEVAEEEVTADVVGLEDWDTVEGSSETFWEKK